MFGTLFRHCETGSKSILDGLPYHDLFLLFWHRKGDLINISITMQCVLSFPLYCGPVDLCCSNRLFCLTDYSHAGCLSFKAIFFLGLWRVIFYAKGCTVYAWIISVEDYSAPASLLCLWEKTLLRWSGSGSWCIRIRSIWRPVILEVS